MSAKQKTQRDDKVSSKRRSPRSATEDFDISAQQQAHRGTIIRRARLDPSSLTASAVQQLQRTIGNRAVSWLLTPTAQHQPVKTKDLVQRMLPEANPQSYPAYPIQAKLTVGQPGDKYEQEADRVASQVVEQIHAPASAESTPGQSVQRQEEPEEALQAKQSISDLQRSPLSPEVQREAMAEEEDLQAKSTLQRQEAIMGGEASSDLRSAINIDNARGGGQPLQTGLQQSIGQAMGADFVGVRVHMDAQSDQLNQSIHAKAYTTRQDVFFRQGAYQLGSRGGQELVANEPTHVVQQNGGGVQRFAIIQRETEYEEKVGDLQKELEKLWSEDDKKEAILKAIEKVYTSEKAVEATKDPAVVKAVLAFVNSKQSKSWQEGTKRKPPGKNDIGKLKDADKWTLRHYTDKYVWNAKKNEVEPPSYREILSSLTLAAMGTGEKGSESDESTLVEKGKVGASKSGHTSKIDWDIIGNVGDTFYGLFYKGKLAGQHQTFLDQAQWYAEWKIGDVSEIWASSDWLGTAKQKNTQPRGDAYEGKPEDVISSFLGMFGRRGDEAAQKKVFESGYDNFEVKVHGSLKLDDSSIDKNWQRVDSPPETEEQKALKK